jgi:hypothetical protein
VAAVAVGQKAILEVQGALAVLAVRDSAVLHLGKEIK